MWSGRPPCLHPAISIHWSCTERCGRADHHVCIQLLPITGAAHNNYRMITIITIIKVLLSLLKNRAGHHVCIQLFPITGAAHQNRRACGRADHHVCIQLFPFTGAAQKGVWPDRPPCLHPAMSIHWSCTQEFTNYLPLLLLLLNCYYCY